MPVTRTTAQTRRNPFARSRPPAEVAPGVWVLGSHRVNFYVVDDGGSLTVVDCGFQGHWRYLAEWLRHHGRREQDVEAVLLTHGHADHVGFAPRLAARGVPVLLHPADAPAAASPAGRRPPQRLRASLPRPAALGLLCEAGADGVFHQPLLNDPTLLPVGRELDLPGRPTAVPVPGHTVGSVAFHLGAAGALVTGDALMTFDPMRGTTGALAFAEHTRRTPEALAATAALAPYAQDRLLPGHGAPWPEPGAVGRALGAVRAV